MLLVIAGAFGVWRFKRKRDRKRQVEPVEDRPELPALPTFPRDKAELEGPEGQGQYSGHANDKKGPRSSVEEVSDEKQTRMDQQEINLMDQGYNGAHGNEMSGSEVVTPELPSPDPFGISELSPEAAMIRSELSTPEPGWPAEMSSPEMVSTEMPAAGVSGAAAGERFGVGPSPLSSPDLAYSKNQALSRHSVPDRIPSSASSRQRLYHTRVDSSDSESTFTSAGAYKSVRPTQHMRADSSDSEAFPIPPQRRPSLPPSRPPHRRLGSKDSSETFETRLEQSPPGSPFFSHPSRTTRDRPIEALPSLGPQSSQEALVSPSAASLRSALRSPEPWELMEEDEDNAVSSETKRKE